MAKSKKNVVKTQRIRRTTYEKQVIKEINQLNYNIRRRLKNVEKGQVTPRYSKVKENYVKLDKSVAKKGIEALERLRNKLRYINSLKSTSVKGTKKANKEVDKVLKHLEDLRDKAGIKPTGTAYEDTKNIRDIADRIYEKLVEQGGWWEKYLKSEVRDDIENLLTDWNMSEDEILDYMQKKLDDFYETGDYESINDLWNDDEENK